MDLERAGLSKVWILYEVTSEKCNSEKVNTFSSQKGMYLYSTTGTFLWSVQFLRVAFFRSDFLQNPYYRLLSTSTKSFNLKKEKKKKPRLLLPFLNWRKIINLSHNQTNCSIVFLSHTTIYWSKKEGKSKLCFMYLKQNISRDMRCTKTYK